MNKAAIIDITPTSVPEIGALYACQHEYSAGWAKKFDWFCRRYTQGLRIKVALDENGAKAGMIEYVPAEYAWRSITAQGYMAIHCLQVNRGYTGQGYGSLLLGQCLSKATGMNGVVIVTSRKPWVNDKAFFLKHGFVKVSTAPPYFELLAKQFRPASPPEFNRGWEERALACGEGITVFYSDQCPITDYAVKNIAEAANELGCKFTLHKIRSAAEAQQAPSPYGTFCIIRDGLFLTHRVFSKQRYIELLK